MCPVLGVSRLDTAFKMQLHKPQTRVIPTLNPLAMLLLTQPGMGLTLLTARSCCWFMFSLLPTKTSRSCSPGQMGSRALALPMCGILCLHLNFACATMLFRFCSKVCQPFPPSWSCWELAESVLWVAESSSRAPVRIIP